MVDNPRYSPEQQALIVSALAGFDPAVIYLLGSYGGPAQHPESDIDLAFLPAAPVAPLVLFNLAGELSERLGSPVDLVDLTQATTVLLKMLYSPANRWSFIIQPFINNLKCSRWLTTLVSMKSATLSLHDDWRHYPQ
jgi:predicted nucleotidyltransferase